MEKLKIFVCAHKADSRIRNNVPYVPIHGGKAVHPDLDLGFGGDNTGDNISEKNPMYSEWSVIYWMWKNCKDAEYIGLNHYRRYFELDITSDNVDKVLAGVDLVAVWNKNSSKCSLLQGLANVTSWEDAYLFADSILSVHPDSKEALLKYLYNSTDSFPYSMFIMRRELFDDYCNFMFPVLFDLERRIKPHGYSRQQRALGYFGEFSLGLFVLYKNLKVKNGGLVSFDKPKEGKMRRVLKFFRNVFFYWIPEMLVPVPKNISVPESIKVGLKNDGITLKSLS